MRCFQTILNFLKNIRNNKKTPTERMKKIGIIMGSESDLPVMNEASKFLDEMNLKVQILIIKFEILQGEFTS